jgi:outer membrane protein OmpA-like peptidoglycan-associated protein
MDWIDFLNKNKNLSLKEEELEAIYKKHGNIKIEQADWFKFKKLNADLDASNADLMEFYMKHGNIKIEQADWFRFKSDKDAAWLSFKNKNADLGATEEELFALFQLHGDIKISRAIWEDYLANKGKKTTSPVISSTSGNLPKTNNTNSPNTEVSTIGFVMFEFGGTIFSSDNKVELDKLAAALVKNKNLNIKLTGHADAIGNDADNQALSLRRANTVNQYLTQYGVAAKQISLQGKGESTPIAINENKDGSDSPEGRKYNRRVDLLVLDPDGNPVQIVSTISIPSHLRAK